jgi:hypothetical protein
MCSAATSTTNRLAIQIMLRPPERGSRISGGR